MLFAALFYNIEEVVVFQRNSAQVQTCTCNTYTAVKLQAYLKVLTCIDYTVNTAVVSQTPRSSMFKKSLMMNDV